MDLKEKHAHRLALLRGIDLPAQDLDAIAAEIDVLERVVAELEEFGKETPWISLQAQPEVGKS